MSEESLPRAPEGGGYSMWIFRYRRGDEFEEIHVPRYDRPGEFRAMMTRARALADEVGGAVAWTDGTTSAMINTEVTHPRHGRPMWLIAWPRVSRSGPTAFRVVECPNIEQHQTLKQVRPPVGGDCDRCAAPTPATEMVVCFLGCEHPQCAACAERTRTEAADEERRGSEDPA